MEMPYVRPTHLEVSSRTPAEEFEDRGGRKPFGSGTREIEQQSLKRVVFPGSVGVSAQCLFGSFRQKPTSAIPDAHVATTY